MKKKGEKKKCVSSDICQQLGKRKCDYRAVIRKATDDDMKTLVDMSTNILRKKVPLSKRHVKLVMQNRKAMRHLVHPQYSLKSKRRFLIKQQSGGGLGSS